jgi:hypothetical protein
MSATAVNGQELRQKLPLQAMMFSMEIDSRIIQPEQKPSLKLASPVSVL